MGRLPFHASCVGWPEDRLPLLEHLKEIGRDVSYEAFSRLVDPESFSDLRDALGHDRRFPMRADPCVRYRVARAEGLPPVAFVVHSAIEHVFATDEAMDAWNERMPGEESSPSP